MLLPFAQDGAAGTSSWRGARGMLAMTVLLTEGSRGETAKVRCGGRDPEGRRNLLIKSIALDPEARVDADSALIKRCVRAATVRSSKALLSPSPFTVGSLTRWLNVLRAEQPSNRGIHAC